MNGPTPKRRGRPPSFDKDAVLERAMLTFWRHGYESTSISDLKKATGLTAPSLYGAFGDKRGLFAAAVARYRGEPGALRRAIEDAPTAHDAAKMLLAQSILRFTGAHTPPGCLLATATASVSEAATDLQRGMTAIRLETEGWLRDRIQRDIRGGILDENVDATTLAAFILCTVQGLSTLARDGADRKKLRAVANQALSAWPPPVAA